MYLSTISGSCSVFWLHSSRVSIHLCCYPSLEISTIVLVFSLFFFFFSAAEMSCHFGCMDKEILDMLITCDSECEFSSSDESTTFKLYSSALNTGNDRCSPPLMQVAELDSLKVCSTQKSGCMALIVKGLMVTNFLRQVNVLHPLVPSIIKYFFIIL